jgi:hypothetical protein
VFTGNCKCLGEGYKDESGYNCMYTMPSGNTHKREVLIVSVDFSKGQIIYSDIAEQVKDLDIGILGE